MSKVICVFGASSCAVDQQHFAVAAELGQTIARRGDVLLFGGGLIGLMGAVARAVHQQGGRVVGIIPEALNQRGVVYERCDELQVTAGMRERKAAMDERSDAFIALPGGFGTLEELLEIITLKQLRYHAKPVVVLNVAGFYDGLLAHFAKLIAERFAKAEHLELYHVAATVAAAFAYLDAYQPPAVGFKWFAGVADKG